MVSKQPLPAASSATASSSLTDMMVARYNRRSGGFSNHAACNGDVRPRTWVNTNRDLDVFNKSSRPSSKKDIHSKPFKVSECKLMGRFDKVVEGNCVTARSKVTTTSTLVCKKDIVVAAAAHNAPSLEQRFVPTTPPFRKRSTIRKDNGSNPSGSERMSREVEPMTWHLSKSRVGDKELSIGRHLSCMAGMTKSDIRLASTCCYHHETNSDVRRPDHLGCSRSNSTLEPSLDHSNSEQWTTHIDAFDHWYSGSGGPQHSNNDSGTNDGSGNGNHGVDNDYAESLRLALEEQENEMLIMALKLSLQDEDQWRHVDVPSSFGITDYEW